ncbi:PD-(D/E)XK motif protein [Gluconobacter oxydans]|uniref:PD-(D/E)XK motif protein n=1 Tax=Gluconobacter oxydans TaxID=442 RepID=UPI00062CA438|nr:PD-(D/E)XK motif protein [Gluconobacter oxydans]
MEDSDWHDIAHAPDPHSDNVRRASSTHPLDFFRGRNYAGQYIFALTADDGCRALPKPPRLNSIDVSVERRQGDGARLVLTLEDRDQFDIFRALCGHLLDATVDHPRGANGPGLRLILRRLADWHIMLRRRHESLLTTEEIIGLVGELLFLRDQVMPRRGVSGGVAAWRGAYRDKQDFALGACQIEVKTQLSTSDHRLLISSEAQLDTARSRLLLCHQAVALEPGGGSAISLNALIDDLAQQVTAAGPLVLEQFETALEACCYTRREEYDEPEWLLIDRRLFEVRDDFPRLTPTMLPAGVHAVSYAILLSACQAFVVDLEATLAEVFA